VSVAVKSLSFQMRCYSTAYARVVMTIHFGRVSPSVKLADSNSRCRRPRIFTQALLF
jgi:hypothetical protein